MKQLKQEALAVAGTIAVVLIGSLAFVTLTMPFVFPFVVVAAIAFLWRKSSKATPGSPIARPPRRVRPPVGRHSPRPLPA